MIIGIGTDLVEVSRIEEKIKKNNAFIEMVFSENEISYCKSMRYPAQHFAARFAAKESLLKAIGKGLLIDIDLSKIDVGNNENGKPFFNFDTTTCSIIAIELGIEKWSAALSMSHTATMASAFVIVSTY